MSAARGESESFQIAVRSPAASALTILDVTVSDLTGPGGAVIDKSNFTLYREHYVFVSEASPHEAGSNPPLGRGWYPDALIPFRDRVTGADLNGTIDAVPFTLVANRAHAFWVDVVVPRNAAAGRYTGSFTVSTNQGTRTGSVALEVWNFALPVRSALKTSFQIWQRNDLGSAEELTRHRISPLRVNAAYRRSLIETHGLGSSDLGFFSNANYNNCRMSEPPPVSQLRQAFAAMPPDLFVYNYTADEIDRCENLFSGLRRWAQSLHEAGVPNLVTMAPTRQLFDDGTGSGRSAVDIWVVLPSMYERAGPLVGQALAKGDEVWSYNTLVQDPHSPKWLIDFTPINFRIQPGFINQALSLTGLLYWRVDLFEGTGWANVNNQGRFGAYNVPGEGMLVYPGAEVGLPRVVPSMRLKWLRDGIEDFDYVDLMRKAGQTPAAKLIVRDVATDWKTWTHDPAVLEQGRTRLGQELDRIGQLPDPVSVPVPASGATGIARSTWLSWIPSVGAKQYDVYLGTTTSPELVGRARVPRFQTALLQAGVTYYWKVIARNELGAAESPLWSFTTAPNGAAPRGPTAFIPGAGSSAKDVFLFTMSEPDGSGNITGATLLVNNGPIYLNACWVYYNRAENTLALASDDTQNWSTATLGSGNMLRNTQCQIDPSASSVSLAGMEMRLTLAVVFLRAFEGEKSIFVKVDAREEGQLQGVGAWTVGQQAESTPPAAFLE